MKILLTREQERRHVLLGPAPGAVPVGSWLDDIVAHIQDGDTRVLDRVREVMDVMLREPFEDGWLDSLDGWRRRLPSWFVEACADERAPDTDTAETRESDGAAEDYEPWELSSYLSWWDPDLRQWRWWDARVDGSSAVRLQVEVDGWPMAYGALEWLLRAAGARAVDLP